MPKIVDHDEYRDEILEKCFRLVSRKGFANVTMRSIAEEVGVSTGTIYHYFPTKEKMLGDLITWGAIKNVSEYILRSKDAEKICDRFELMVVFWKESGDFYQNLMLLAIDMYRKSSADQWEKVYAFFSKYYVDAMTEKLQISPLFAQSIFIHFLGIIFHSLLTSEKDDYIRLIDILSRMIEPLIVEVSDDMVLAVEKTRENIVSMLMKNSPEITGTLPAERKIDQERRHKK